MYKLGQRYAPVHSVVWNNYWGQHYKVLSHNRNGSVTVQWEGSDTVVTHRTPFMPDRDRVVRSSEHEVTPQTIEAIAMVHAGSQVSA